MRVFRVMPLVVVLILAGCWGDAGHESVEKEEPSPTPPGGGINGAARPSSRPKRIFERMPPAIRRQRFPMSEVDVATAIWRAESKDEVPGILTPLVAPGQAIEGWLCQVNWAVLRQQGGSSKYEYDGMPTLYEFTFRFPEGVGDYEVWLWAHNYDFGKRTFSIPNDDLKGIRDGDWVRIGGVFRPGSKVEWEPTKSSELLSLGELVLSRIQKLDVEAGSGRSQ
jgi:hypothetical protein